MDIFDKEYDAIRDRIFDLLKEQKMSQRDFAQAIQVSPQTITDWKKGKSRSFSTMISVIANTLHTTPEWIYFGEGMKFLSDEQRMELESQERERIQQMQAMFDTKEKETKQYVINSFRKMMDRNGFMPSDFAIDTVEHFAEILGTTAEYLLTGEGPMYKTANANVSNSDTQSDGQLMAAFFDGGEDLSEEEMAALWQDAKDYIQWKLSQRRKAKDDQ